MRLARLIAAVMLLAGQCLGFASDGDAQGSFSPPLNSHPELFCNGADGNVTISSGITTITRDMCYQNLTISGTGVLATSSFRVFVAGTLDISAAPAASIHTTGIPPGGNASGAAGGSASGTVNQARTVGGGSQGGNGGTGNTTTGSVGTAGATFAGATGGDGSSGGAGGAGVSAGAAGLAGGTQNSFTRAQYAAPSLVLVTGQNNNTAGNMVQGGLGGGGGGQGGGDGANAGGGGGAGGNGNGVLAIFANVIARGSNSTAGIIDQTGGAGGNGANGVAGTAGGGAGGGGGGGGFVYIVAGAITGSVITNAIVVTGGAGGNGGNSPATHTGGTGGTGGNGGAVNIINLAAGTNSTTSFNAAGSAGTGPTGITGGPGGAGAVVRSNL